MVSENEREGDRPSLGGGAVRKASFFSCYLKDE